MKISLKSFLSLSKYLVSIVIVFTIVMVIITVFMPISMENFEESVVESIDTKPITTSSEETTSPATTITPVTKTPNIIKKCSKYDNDETKCNKSFHSGKGVNCIYSDNKCRMIKESE